MSVTKPEVVAELAPEVSVQVADGTRTYTLTMTGAYERRVEIVGVDQHGQVVAELNGVMSGDLSVLAQLFAAGHAALQPVRRPPVTLDQRRAKHSNSHRPWTEADDERLRQLAAESGASINGLKVAFGRSREAIVKRLERLEIDPKSLPTRV